MKKQIFNIQIIDNQFVITYNNLKYKNDFIPYNENSKEELIRILKKETKVLNREKEILKSLRDVTLAIDILSIIGTIFSYALFNNILLKIAISFTFLEISIILAFTILAFNCSINELESKFDYNDLLKVERLYLKNKKIINFAKYKENILLDQNLTLSKFPPLDNIDDNSKPKVIKFKQK